MRDTAVLIATEHLTWVESYGWLVLLAVAVVVIAYHKHVERGGSKEEFWGTLLILAMLGFFVWGLMQA